MLERIPEHSTPEPSTPEQSTPECIMFERIHAVAIYCGELDASVARYRQLGLEVLWTEEAAGSKRVGLHFAAGSAELVLHDDITRQFNEATLAVADIHALYEALRSQAGFLWFEPPHRTPQGCAAFVRLPDGNAFSLLTPDCVCAQPSREPAYPHVRPHAALPAELHQPQAKKPL